MFSLICVWIKGWVNNRGAGDLRRYRAHYDVTVMRIWYLYFPFLCYPVMFSSLIYSVVCSMPTSQYYPCIPDFPSHCILWLCCCSFRLSSVSFTWISNHIHANVFYCACDHLSMLQLKLDNVSKKRPWSLEALPLWELEGMHRGFVPYFQHLRIFCAPSQIWPYLPFYSDLVGSHFEGIHFQHVDDHFAPPPPPPPPP